MSDTGPKTGPPNAMLSKIELPSSGEYRTGTDREPLAFYLDALLESTRLDLLLGYFSSSAIRVLSLGFARFLSGGGRVRMVINQMLSEKDKAALLVGERSATADFDLAATDFADLKRRLDSSGRHFFECLAWLIASRRLEIVAVRPKGKRGISHYKSGIFSDGEDEIAFKSSCNFTASGFLENLEELSVKCSWSGAGEREAIAEQHVYFENIFFKRADFVEFVPFENIETSIVEHFGGRTMDELLADESQLLEETARHFQQKHVREAIERAKQKVGEWLRTPRFPFADGPRDYQIQAHENWLKNGSRGIFAMATGTGKTITALNCLLLESQKRADKIFQAVILVPTISLVGQWEKEAEAFRFSGILKVSSKTDWERDLDRLLASMRFGGAARSFILIATYATFYRERFQYFFKKLPADALFIADEGHNLASPRVQAVLPNVHLKKRIGLSATPRRIYDPEGTAAMEAFFSDREPFVFSLPMEQAIESGALCRYRYFPHIVELLPAEMLKYAAISKKLARYFDGETGQSRRPDLTEKLLLARKRIIQKAANKLDQTRRILQKKWVEQGHLKFTFVYVPEGFSPENEEIFQENEADLRIIDQYTQAIGLIHPSVRVHRFTGFTPDRETILGQFQKGEIHVLASMKCLDEGIDVPRAELAIFCSSTGNPRQFIQRRGRVLRQHPEKHLAEIHDLVVVPPLEGLDERAFRMERSLVRKELERVAHFAFMAINRYHSLDALRAVCEHYQLNLHEIHEKLRVL